VQHRFALDKKRRCGDFFRRKGDFIFLPAFGLIAAAGGSLNLTTANPPDEAVHQNCFRWYEPAKACDFVFTRYAP
jgi:hypothetical protein